MNEQLLGSIQKECVDSVEDLMGAHVSELDTALQMLEGVVTVNIGFTIDTTGEKPKIKTKMGFFVNRVKDEREVTVDDGQAKLF